MRVAALILGIIGGLIGIGDTVFATVVEAMFSDISAEALGLLRTMTIAFCVMGLTGGALALAKPTLASVLMVLSGIWLAGCVLGEFSTAIGGLASAALLLIGGILAACGAERRE